MNKTFIGLISLATLLSTQILAAQELNTSANLMMPLEDLAQGSEIEITGANSILIEKNRAVVDFQGSASSNRLVSDEKNDYFYHCQLFLTSVSKGARIIQPGTVFKVFDRYSNPNGGTYRTGKNGVIVMSKNLSGEWRVSGVFSCENVLIFNGTEETTDTHKATAGEFLKALSYKGVSANITIPKTQEFQLDK